MTASEITKMKATLNVKNKLIFFVIALVVLNIINLKFCFSFFVNSVTILLLLFIIFGIIFFTFGTIELFIFKELKTSKYIGMMALCFIFTIVTGYMISEYRTHLSKEKATVIINALHNYEQAHNEYPEDLSDLIPEFLESIPSSSMGWFDEPFEYYKRKDGSFDIYFPSYGGDSYMSSAYSNGKWIKTD